MDEPRRSRFGLGVGLLAIVAAAGWLTFGRGRPAPAPPFQPVPVEEAEPDSASAVSSTAEPEAPDDDAVHAEVQELLATSPALQEARLEVAVANGIVTLSGEAPSATARELAATLARTATGAKRVFNLINIAASAGGITASVPTPAPVAPAPSAEAVPSRPAAPTEPPKEAQVRELLDKARRQIESGDHDGAGRTFEEVLRLDPDNFVAKDALERRRAHPPPPPPPR